MITLLFVHNYNISTAYQTPSSFADTPMSFISFTEYFFSNSLFRFRIPLLMAISGYLLASSYNYSYTELISKKIRTILIPFAIIAIIGFFTCVVFDVIDTQFYTINASGIFGKSITEFRLYDVLYHTFIAPSSFQLWYLKIMFVMAVCLPIIRFLLTKLPIATLSVLAIAWLFTNYLGGETKDRGYIFFFIGFYLSQHNKNIAHAFINVKYTGLALITLALLRTYLAFSPNHTEITSMLMVLSFKLIGILGAYTCWFMADKLVTIYYKFSFFRNLTKSSFFIFAFHAPLITLAGLALRKYVLHSHEQFFMAYLLLPLVVATIIILIDHLIRNKFSITYTLITGGRNALHKQENVDYFYFLHNIQLSAIYPFLFGDKAKQQWQHLQYYTLVMGIVLYKIFH